MHPYDFIAFILIGISHVLLYIRLIRYHQLSFPMVIGLSVVFMILLGVVVTVTGYPEFNIILLFLFLLCLGMMKPGLTFMQSVYFVLISSVSITFTRMILMEIGMALFMWSPLNLYTWTVSLLHLIVSMIITASILLWYKQIQRYALFIVTSRLYFVSYGLFIIGIILIIIINYPTSYLLAPIHEEYGQISYIAALILFFILLLFTLISSHLAKRNLVEEHQERLDKELLGYVESLERAHDDLATFRHDYTNVLLALDEGVRTKDIEQIEQVFNDVIAPTSELINHHELDIIKLSSVMIPELKSVLSVKVIAAQQQQVLVTVDIPQKINTVAIPLIDFIRMISILLDNALEELVHSEGRSLQIAFFEIDEKQYFIVRNSCAREVTDVQKLYEKGYSTKGKNQGYGLFSLRHMIDKTNNITLETKSKHGFFTQTLILRKS